MSQIGGVNSTTNKVRRDWLLLPQNSYANHVEDLIKDIVAHKIILLTIVLPLGLPYKNKQQRSLVDILALKVNMQCVTCGRKSFSKQSLWCKNTDVKVLFHADQMCPVLASCRICDVRLLPDIRIRKYAVARL